MCEREERDGGCRPVTRESIPTGCHRRARSGDAAGTLGSEPAARPRRRLGPAETDTDHSSHAKCGEDNTSGRWVRVREAFSEKVSSGPEGISQRGVFRPRKQ